MDTKRRHIVIIGGGFAGVAAAQELEKAEVDVTIIDKSNHHLFQPLLYQVATAALSPGDIATPIRTIFEKSRNIKVVLGEVNKICAETNKIKLISGREFDYDQLILAPGAKYNYFGHDEWQQYASGLKTLSDALNMRERILLSLEEAEQIEDPAQRRAHLTYVIIGGGPTGVEMAGAIAEIAGTSMRKAYKNIKEEEVKVVLLEAAPNILNGFADPLGAKGHEMLRKMGVRVLHDTPVVKIEKDRVHLKVGSIHSTNIIWAAGIKASPLLDFLKVQKDRSGRVKVGADLSVPEYPDIYILGDSAHFENEDGKVLPALASVAIQQGKFLGRLLSAEVRNAGKRFEYINKGSMATIGRAKAVADIRGFKFSGFFAWLVWSFVHLLLLNGFRNRIKVVVEWVWNYFTFNRGVQLITDRSGCMYCQNSGNTGESPYKKIG